VLHPLTASPPAEEQETDEYCRAYVTQYDPSAAPAAPAPVWQFCTADELAQRIEAELGRPVLPHRTDPVLPAFMRPDTDEGAAGAGNVDGAAVRRSGFDNCFTDTVSWSFFEGQPVLVNFEPTRRAEPNTACPAGHVLEAFHT
jgi:hypothetical protein